MNKMITAILPITNQFSILAAPLTPRDTKCPTTNNDKAPNKSNQVPLPALNDAVSALGSAIPNPDKNPWKYDDHDAEISAKAIKYSAKTAHPDNQPMNSP